MKSRPIILGIAAALTATAVIGGTIALADYYAGPYTAYTNHSINWNGSPYYLNILGTIYHYADWKLYWSDAQSRYTKYQIQSDGYGAISVSSSSSYGVTKETVDLYNYQWSRQGGTYWWDTVYPGYYWSHTFPNNTPELDKPASGSDYTSMSWSFDWNYLIYGSARPLDYLDFYYSGNTFEYGQGLD